jgi:hypothetical protein
MIEHSANLRREILRIIKIIDAPKKSKRRVCLMNSEKLEYHIDLPTKEAESLDKSANYLGVLERVSAADFLGDDPRKQIVCTQYEELTRLEDKEGKIVYQQTPTIIKDCLAILEKSIEPEQKTRIKTLDDRAIKEDLDLGIRVRSVLRLWNSNPRSDYFRQKGIEDVMDMSNLVLKEYRDYLKGIE